MSAVSRQTWNQGLSPRWIYHPSFPTISARSLGASLVALTALTSHKTLPLLSYMSDELNVHRRDPQWGTALQAAEKTTSLLDVCKQKRHLETLIHGEGQGLGGGTHPDLGHNKQWDSLSWPQRDVPEHPGQIQGQWDRAAFKHGKILVVLW